MILDKNEGQFLVTSDPGKGSCFAISLPIAPEEERPVS
jgi:hypothetical protein